MSFARSDVAGHATLRFLGRFVRHPATVGAIVPSTAQLAAAMIAPLLEAAGRRAVGEDTHTAPITVVELGPGTGAFTRAIVQRLTANDRFLAVELELEFCALLQRRWPPLDAVCASAESLTDLLADRRWGPVDHIVSGLPFATLPTQTTRRIVDAIGRSLRLGGTFTTFHYAHSFGVPRAAAFRREICRVLQSSPSAKFIAWNLPPALAVSWTNRLGSRPVSDGDAQPSADHGRYPSAFRPVL